MAKKEKLSRKQIHLVSNSEDAGKASMESIVKEAEKLDPEIQEKLDKALKATFQKHFSKGINNGVGSWDSSDLKTIEK